MSRLALPGPRRREVISSPHIVTNGAVDGARRMVGSDAATAEFSGVVDNVWQIA